MFEKQNNPEKRFVNFRGKQVVEGWPEKLEAAQKSRHFLIDGKSLPRIAWGNETMELEEAKRNWEQYYKGAPALIESQMKLVEDEINQEKAQPCPDCVAVKGELHVWPCDREECPNCHHQAMACSCNKELAE